MADFLHHLETVERCSFYSAPSTPIRPAHVHENFELVEVITGGKVYWEVDGNTQIFGRGAIFWHKGGEHTVYRTPPDDPYRCGVWCFKVKSPERPVPRIGFWNNTMDLDAFVSDSINAFHAGQIPQEAMGMYCYGVLLRHMLNQNNISTQYPPPLAKAIKLIDRNPASALNIDFIAMKSEVSKPYLFALFKKYLGTAPHRYILEQQLAKARALLVSTDSPIKDIAEQCGFDTLEVFYRQFRKLCGITPGEYRSKNSIKR